MDRNWTLKPPATHTLTVRTTDVDSNTYDEDFTISLSDLAEENEAVSDLSSGIELNTDGGNDAFLISDDGGAILGERTSFTFETTFSTSAGEQVLISYAADGASSNVLLVRLLDNGNLELRINNTPTVFTIAGDDILHDGEVHSLAISWDNTFGDINVYIDGALAGEASGVQVGNSLAGSAGTAQIVFGQEQDNVGGGFNSNQKFSGTLYDVRIWDEVRTAGEIESNHDRKLDSGSLPDGLIANWQFDGFNGLGEIVDVVSGNNLNIGHASGTGFITSTPVDDLHISENAGDGNNCRQRHADCTRSKQRRCQRR